MLSSIFKSFSSAIRRRTGRPKLPPIYIFTAQQNLWFIYNFKKIFKKSLHNAGEIQVSTYQIIGWHCQGFHFVGHGSILLTARTPHQNASTPYAVTSRPVTSHGLSLPVPKGSLAIATHRKGKWRLWLKQNSFLTLLSNSAIRAAIQRNLNMQPQAIVRPSRLIDITTHSKHTRPPCTHTPFWFINRDVQ